MEKDSLQIGWIGTGVMGFSMCKHLLNAGYKVNVFNRTKSKADKLLQLGAIWQQPKQIAKTADILFLMLGFPKDLEDMCFGQHSIIKQMKKGSILIDHTTSRPNLAEKIYQQCRNHGVQSLDAPVSGGDIGAKEGKLVVMCGGDQKTWEKATPIMQKYSRKVEYNGGPGKGQHTKCVNQIILAGNMAGTIQGLMYASKSGLDLMKTVDTILLGAASSTSLSIMGKRIINQDYNPGFYVEHYIKDMQICLQECGRMDLSLPCLALVKQFYTALRAQGGGKLGTQALIKVFQNMNNHKLHKNQ